MSFEWLAVLMFLGIFITLSFGYPIGPTFAGTAMLFALIGLSLGAFKPDLFRALPDRWFGTMSDYTYLAIPYFVYMGTILEKSGLAEDLLETVGILFGPIPGGLALGVILVGALLGAATGVVAASVIAMGLISLPIMLRYGYDKELATGAIASAGTITQLIPPATVLVVLADQLGISVGELFVGSIVPSIILTTAYGAYCVGVGFLQPHKAPPMPAEARAIRGRALAVRVAKALLPTLALILAVLGSIYAGFATPTEAGAVGALGGVLLAIAYRKFSLQLLKDAAYDTLRITSLVILILFGSTIFSLVFDGLGGTKLMVSLLTNLPGGYVSFLIFSMVAVFLLGIFLEFIEICFIVMPIFVPACRVLGIDLAWFGILMTINLLTAFLSPPVGFTLFYLSSVAPPEVKIEHIFRGVVPFMIVTLIVLVIVMLFPGTVTYLVEQYRK
ncbi:MAG TPA: TRAP transporter large permease subunit [Roseiflexaceae bacterium]|nr:TRAP transporter large permease subunit [Roseiflexaceae bacterium]